MTNSELKKELSPGHREELIEMLKARFKNNNHRHINLEWKDV